MRSCCSNSPGGIAKVHRGTPTQGVPRFFVVALSYDLATACYVADEIAIMLRGWIVEKGSPEKVRSG